MQQYGVLNDLFKVFVRISRFKCITYIQSIHIIKL